MFERLHKHHGQRVCESYKRIFSEIYGDGNYKIISDQLDKLNEFIEDSESVSTVDTFIDPINSISMNRIWMTISKRIKERTNSDENLKLQNDIYLKYLIEYSRLKHGYYKNRIFISSYITFFSSIAAEVYGKYFLYKQWLEDKRNELEKKLPPQQTTEQMKENLLQLVACSKGDEIIDEIDKIYLDTSLSTSRKIVLIGDRKDIFKLGENNIKDGVVSISFDEKKYIFPEWKITRIVDCCKDRLKKLKRRQKEEVLIPQPSKIKVGHEFNNSFLHLLISGIYELQEKRGDKEYFIHYLKKNNEKDEAGFRDWFSEFFQRYGCKTLPDRKKENKKIDLVVKYDDFGEKKIEFKIWYNPDKEEIVNQIYSYLTDFNDEGYIFMINDTKSPIIDEYKKIVTQNPQNKWDEKWETQVYNGLPYYTSRHNIGANPKTIHHFIFNIYP